MDGSSEDVVYAGVVTRMRDFTKSQLQRVGFMRRQLRHAVYAEQTEIGECRRADIAQAAEASCARFDGGLAHAPPPAVFSHAAPQAFANSRMRRM